MLSSKNSKETHKFCLLLSSSPNWGGGGGVPGGVPCQGGTLPGGIPCWGVPCQGGTLLGGYPARGFPARGYPAGGYHAGGVPCRGGPCWVPPPSLLAGGGPTSVVSKLQLSSSAVSCPYIAFSPMELWVMLQSIMAVKKKNYGMGTPPPSEV